MSRRILVHGGRAQTKLHEVKGAITDIWSVSSRHEDGGMNSGMSSGMNSGMSSGHQIMSVGQNPPADSDESAGG